MSSNGMSLPPGVDLSDDQSPTVVRSAVASMVLSLLFYVLRLVSRKISNTPFIASDYVLFGGVIACYVISGVDIWVVRLGLGKHIEVVAMADPTLDGVKTMMKYLMVDTCFYAFGQVTVKISLLLLYRYLFTSKRLHLWINITIIFMLAWGVAVLFGSIFSCNPINAFWDFELQGTPGVYCINFQAFWISVAVPNILTDVLILAMPIWQVWKLQLNRRSKIALTFIFLLGSFVIIASIIRLVSLTQINITDDTYTLVGISNWSSIEFAMAVVSASLPTLRPLVNKFASKSWKTSKTLASSTTSPESKRVGSRRECILLAKSGDSLHSLHDNGNETYALHNGWVDSELQQLDLDIEKDFVFTRDFSTNVGH
ncbi:hypothetical protein MMC17_004331 [Xylographa soralifera]|nr:hypothetical protein [Xylographa soralifera]